MLASVIKIPICKYLFQIQDIHAPGGKVGGLGEEHIEVTRA